MNALSKRVSESLLEKLAQELIPDVPTHNKLARSWQEHEKSKQHRSRSLKKEVDQIKLKMFQSTKALALGKDVAGSAGGAGGGGGPGSPGADDKQGASDSVSAAIIPGFRYRANGDERQSRGESSRKPRAQKSLPGKSKNRIHQARRPKSSTTGKPSHDKSASENVKIDVFDYEDEYEVDVIPSHKSSKTSRRMQEEEAAHFRIRKVQEQLGLTRKPNQQYVQGTNHMETSLEMEHLSHALKVLGFVLRDPDKDSSALNSPVYLSKTSLSTLKPVVQYPDISAESRREVGILAGGPIRERCEACRHVYRNDIQHVAKPADPEAYKKPRWRLSPSGRYVPPPLKSLKFSNPALYSRTEELGSFGGRGIMGQPGTSSTPSFPTPTITTTTATGGAGTTTTNKADNIVSDTVLSLLVAVNSFSNSDASGVDFMSAAVSGTGSGSGGGGSTARTSGATIVPPPPPHRRVSLDVMKEKNNMEAELLKKRMRNFLDSMQTDRVLSPAHSAPTPLQMVRVESEAHKFSGF